jgi:hypothetical protein
VPECDEKTAKEQSETSDDANLIAMDENSGGEHKKFKIVSILYMIFKP